MPRDRDTPFDDPQFDLSPWIESPGSSRVSRFRYDHANHNIQVQWTNQKNDGYVYQLEGEGTEAYEQYRQFARAVSKGKKINSFLNQFEYREMTQAEVHAPSNANRRGLQSRVNG